MKRISKLLLVFLLTLAVIAGCENKEKDTGKEESAKTESVAEESTEKASEAEGKEAGGESKETEDSKETVTALKDVAAVNAFLNESAALGEGSKANAVAVIPINHIDGPKNEDLFYGFVNFKYVSRDFIKYQVTYLSCTCRSADVNHWSTAYVELSLPRVESWKIRLSSTSALIGIRPTNIR